MSNDAGYEAFTPDTVPEPSHDVLYSAHPNFPDMSDEDKFRLMRALPDALESFQPLI